MGQSRMENAAYSGLGFAELVAEAEGAAAIGGPHAAAALYQAWISGRSVGEPQLHLAWFNLASVLNGSGDVQGAIVGYRIALAQRPEFHQAAINLGLLLEQAGDAGSALDVWRKAMQGDDARTALINHEGRLLEQSGLLAEAERALFRSLLTTPLQPDVIQHWVHLRQRMCLWPALGEVPGLTAGQVGDYCGPLAALALFDRVATQTRVAAAWIERKTAPAASRLSPDEGYRHDRLRIGYLSSDFCRHAMSFLVAELFERHDRSRFEIYGYCATQEDGSDIRQRVLAAFDHVRPIRHLSDEAAAKLIRSDEIDVLVDLNGLTRGARLQVLRWRPAPVQATYLGFVGPVPLPELDYLFCDDFVVPDAVAAEYRPAPLAIAPMYQANDSRREAGPVPTRLQAGLPDTGFVFCCFSNHYKITETMFADWLAILRRVDGSVLWLVADNEWSCANLRCAAERHGVDPERIVFGRRVPPAEYMARLGVADLFLDTCPYNAGTVASDATRMGLPLLTLAGEAFASRMAARLLLALDAGEGIAESREAYVEAAVRLATDADAYSAYKQKFSFETWARTVGDIGALTRQLEATLARIARKDDRPATKADRHAGRRPLDGNAAACGGKAGGLCDAAE